jgi:hypothetical protein
MSKRPAEDEQRASAKLAKAEPPEPEKQATDIDVPALSAWLEGWLKQHEPSEGWRDPSLSLEEDIQGHMEFSIEDNFSSLLTALKEQQNISIQDDAAKASLQDKLCDTLSDYIRCKALSEFVTDEFAPGFRNRKRKREFEQRMEEGFVDQLQFDVVYDFAIYIATNGVEDSDESDDDEEPAEEEDSEHSDSEDESEGSEEEGSESESDED